MLKSVNLQSCKAVEIHYFPLLQSVCCVGKTPPTTHEVFHSVFKNLHSTVSALLRVVDDILMSTDSGHTLWCCWTFMLCSIRWIVKSSWVALSTRSIFQVLLWNGFDPTWGTVAFLSGLCHKDPSLGHSLGLLPLGSIFSKSLGCLFPFRAISTCSWAARINSVLINRNQTSDVCEITIFHWLKTFSSANCSLFLTLWKWAEILNLTKNKCCVEG